MRTAPQRGRLLCCSSHAVSTFYRDSHLLGYFVFSARIAAVVLRLLQVVEQAIADLEYGAVHINTDTKLSIAFPSLVWGGCPGSTIYELNSGIGFVRLCSLCPK